jgi:hypothetical protein
VLHAVLLGAKQPVRQQHIISALFPRMLFLSCRQDSRQSQCVTAGPSSCWTTFSAGPSSSSPAGPATAAADMSFDKLLNIHKANDTTCVGGVCGEAALNMTGLSAAQDNTSSVTTA